MASVNRINQSKRILPLVGAQDVNVRSYAIFVLIIGGIFKKIDG
jgi:hypothetical protein